MVGGARAPLHTLLVTIAAMPMLGVPALGQVVARAPADKPAVTVLRRVDDPNRVVVKFHEDTGARLRQGRVLGAGVDDAALTTVLDTHGVAPTDLRRLFPRPEADLDAERRIAQRRSGRVLADLNLYYWFAVPPGVDTGELCDALNALPFVELAAPMPRPAPPPTDISPPTPDFAALQGYRAAPPAGIGAIQVAHLPGADGSGVELVDLEYSWVFDHEDVELGDVSIDSATPVDPFPNGEGNHGTAVLGELVARDNGYGVLGLVRGVTLRVAPTNTHEFGFNIGRAVSLAASVLAEGDVILIEQQLCICNRHCDDQTQEGFGPVEDFLAWYDAIATATAMGITVVEPAGNGNRSLDESGCRGRFDRSRGDSGAIIVGAGTVDTHARVPTSSWGSRIDVQGWGELVATTGYGDLFDPGDLRQRYTGRFAGTSSAAALIAGTAAIIQGAHRARGLPPLSPASLRQLLVDTGTPEGDPAEHIGPLSNLLAALADLIPTTTPTPRPTVTATPTRTATIAPSPTRSSTPTNTARPTATPSPTRTRTVRPTATRSRTRTRTPTVPPTPTPSLMEQLIARIVHGIFRGSGVDTNADGRVTAADITCAVLGTGC